MNIHTLQTRYLNLCIAQVQVFILNVNDVYTHDTQNPLDVGYLLIDANFALLVVISSFLV